MLHFLILLHFLIFHFIFDLIKSPLGILLCKKLKGKFVAMTFFAKTFALRAYPKSPPALNVIHAHAKCSIAR